MVNPWFETVAEAQRRAKRRLPPSVYGALVAGSEQGLTVRDNINAFSELGFWPHAAGLSAQREQATTVMGQPVSMPVIISPTGVQAVHPEGEVAVARAAAARGTVMGSRWWLRRRADASILDEPDGPGFRQPAGTPPPDHHCPPAHRLAGSTSKFADVTLAIAHPGGCSKQARDCRVQSHRQIVPREE